jgi:hypothetical protein
MTTTAAVKSEIAYAEVLWISGEWGVGKNFAVQLALPVRETA